jgi:hypothetical protein
MYVSEVLAHVSKNQPSDNQQQKYVAIMSVACELANCGSKFILPDGGEAVKDRDFKAFPFGSVRLPFPVVTLEYFEPDQDTGDGTTWAAHRRIVVLEEMEIDGSPHIEIWPICHNKNSNAWCFQDPIRIPCDITYEEVSHKDGIFKIARADHFNHTGIKFSAGDYMGEICAFMSFLSALSCNNVMIEKVPNTRPTPKGSLNPLPFDEYHVLSLKSRSGDESTCNGGNHRSPREHLRRGHIRRLVNGEKTWVNACVVNAGTSGKVRKSYFMNN